jgi:hypothetical protein
LIITLLADGGLAHSTASLFDIRSLRFFLITGNATSLQNLELRAAPRHYA